MKNQYTILLITHNLRQARSLADYVIFLYLGNLIEHGPAEQVLKNPKYLKTQSYINGEFIEEPIIAKELNLKETVPSDNYRRVKYALENLEHGQVLKIVLTNEPAVSEIPSTIEFGRP